MAEINFKRIQDKNLTPEIIVEKAKAKGRNIDLNSAERLLKTARKEIKEKSYNDFMYEFMFDGGKHYGVLTDDQLRELHEMGNGVPGLRETPSRDWDEDWYCDNIFNSSFERKKKIVNTILDFLSSSKPKNIEWDEYFIPLTDDEEEVLKLVSEDTNASRHEKSDN